MSTSSPSLSARSDRHAGRRELAIFGLAYLTYFGVRALTQGDAAAALAHARDVLEVERDVGLAHERAVQALVIGSHTLTDAVNAIYMYGHWPVLILSGLLLFRFRREHYWTLRNACLLSGLVGIVIFAAFPVAPPRLTGGPIVDTVTARAGEYRHLLPTSLVNEYAAMPSFHAGWNLLAGIVIFRATGHLLLRAFAVAMPAAMAFTVVATANHYLLDVVFGVAIVLVALRVVDVHQRGRAAPTLKDDQGRHGEPPDAEHAPAVRHRPSRRERPATLAHR